MGWTTEESGFIPDQLKKCSLHSVQVDTLGRTQPSIKWM
jgi:hypothetical protein